jgi:hypothetical protein
MGIKKISGVESAPKPMSALDRISPPKTTTVKIASPKVAIASTNVIKKSGNIVSDVLQFFNGRIIEL